MREVEVSNRFVGAFTITFFGKSIVGWWVEGCIVGIGFGRSLPDFNNGDREAEDGTDEGDNDWICSTVICGENGEGTTPSFEATRDDGYDKCVEIAAGAIVGSLVSRPVATEVRPWFVAQT